MTHHTNIRYLVRHWELFAMRDGYTLHHTQVYAEPVTGGFLPAFVGKHGIRVIVELAAPLPTERAARNCLRDVLWQAHAAERISLMQHPLESLQEQAA